MKTKVMIIVAMLLCVVSSAQAATVWERVKALVGLETQPKAPTIKVLVGKDVEGAMLEVKGKYNIYDPFKDSRLGTRFFGKSNYIQPVTEGLKWGEVFPGVFQIVVVPDDAETTVVVNGIEYRGTLFVYQTGDRLQLVNEVPVEDYVHSILAVQCDKPASQEVLAAMAIALRTDACYEVLSDRDAAWHVDAERVGYTGFAITKRDNFLKDIMTSTRHLVLSRTRSYEGELVPIQTACLDKEYGRNHSPTGWDITKAQMLASKGQNAAKILHEMYPEAWVEMLTTLESTDEKAPEKKATAVVDPEPKTQSESIE